MSLPESSIRYRPIVLTLVGLAMVWGVISYLTMPRREDPEYTVRVCAVSTRWPGAPAEKVEELVTYPLELAIDRIDDVQVVFSTTQAGLSTIYVETEDWVASSDIDNVWDKVRAYVRRVKMPESSIVPDVNDEYGDTAIIIFSVHQIPLPGEEAVREGHRYSLRQLDLFSERIRDELRVLPGVAKAEQVGVIEEAVYLETSLENWSQIGLTTRRLEALAQARNIVLPGGTVDTDVGRYFVKPGGELDALSEMDSLIVDRTRLDENEQPVYLRDLGITVRRGYQDPPLRICRYGDEKGSRPAVMVTLTMKSGANIIDICDAAKARVAELQEIERVLPPDLGLVTVSDQSINVTKKIDDVVSNVIGAVIIVVVVVYLIIGFRAAGVMAANIPVVVLIALGAVTFFDVQLEQISLASIIIALGLLVDNAVQVCTQARANQLLGMKPIQAAVTGSKQVSSAMLMGTATTVAAFAPMLVGLQGSKKEYVYSLPVTLSVTLGVSWVLAMTFCTILAAAFVRAPEDPEAPAGPLAWVFTFLARLLRRGRRAPESEARQDGVTMRIFGSFVSGAIRLKWITFAASVAAFMWAISLPVGSEFFPQDERDQFAIQIWTPESSSIATTDEKARQVEEIIRRLSPIESGGGQRLRGMRTIVGGGGSRWYLSWDPEPILPNYAEILVRTTEASHTPWLARRIREVAEGGDAELGLEPIVGARVVPKVLFLGPSSPPVELRVYGPGFADMATLRGYADRVKEMVAEAPGTWDTADSWGVSGLQLRIDVDQDKANLAGVSSAAIANSLSAYLSGHQLTTFREGDHQVPIYLRLDPDDRQNVQGIETAFVEGIWGKVPLNSMAKITNRWEPIRIGRRDINRMIEVTSEVEPGVRGNDVVQALLASDAMKELEAEMPAGYRVEVGGNLENSQEGSEELGTALVISLLTIILLLVIQYNGWSKPVIILATLPLALVGALPGLYFTGNALGFMPQLGILSLFGIVLNTAIIFMEFADVLILEAVKKSDGSGPICGITKQEFRGCLVAAGKQRLLPIFLTTATTIGGLIPLAVSGGPLWRGMAWCMIYGLAIATVLTLVVVPALYAILVEFFRVKPVRVEDPLAG